MSASPKHRSSSRPRLGRIAALAAAAAVVATALVGSAWSVVEERDAAPAALTKPLTTPSETPATTPSPEAAPVTVSDSVAAEPPAPDPAALPAASGTGRRVVFSQSAQRVWLVDQDGSVERTYLVSGSVSDNLHPGSYAVYSTSRWAVGVDDSGVMEYFVRFTQGPTGAAIGFHTIPTKDGTPLQTKKQLGTPQSHGCIRQRTPDAIALWDFAPLGTKVVVV